MNSLKLTADFFILAVALIWPVICSDVCDADGFQMIQHTTLRAATEYPNENNAWACKTRCLQEDGCKGVDWNFADSTCWLYFDAHLKTDESVTHYHNCLTGPLPFSTEDPQTAGFPAIDRSHTYHLTEKFGEMKFPIIFMQPPLDSAAGFSEATVRDVELYIKWTGEVDFIAHVGIARPKGGSLTDGFDFIVSRAEFFSHSFYLDGEDGEGMQQITHFDGKVTLPSTKISFDPQPGDAIYIASIHQVDDSYGIPYDIGTPDVCGVTSVGVIDIDFWTLDPASLKTLDECWMMSLSIGLTPSN